MDNRGHHWVKLPNGTVDTSLADYENHSGPMCEICGYSFCEFCHENPPEPCRFAPPFPPPQVRETELL